jgi:glutathione S-transferase
MADITVFGFPHSSFVHITQLVLMHKEVPYTFHDLEPDMGSPKHLVLHPFDRVPILQHGDFVLYETSAIVAYLEERFPTPRLYPATVEGRARMNQWISAVNSYYYPYMIYHVGHERNVFPRARHPVRREAGGARPPQDRGRAAGGGKAAVARRGFFTRRRGDTCRLLSAAEHLFILADGRGQGDVPGLSSLLSLARADGGLTDRAAAPSGDRGPAADRTCEEVGCLAPAKILISCEKTGARRPPVRGCSFKLCPFGDQPSPFPAYPASERPWRRR